MTVHDVDMNSVGAGALGLDDLLTQPREIGSED
jgi:hypothetical protein